jgi:fructoselysine and glucoselysine-specific PTS system IIA component
LPQGQISDEWVLFTDLLGGSITNQILRHVGGDGGVPPTIHIVAGFNLPLLIEILLADESRPLKEVIEDAIAQAKDQLVYVNKLMAPTHNND